MTISECDLDVSPNHSQDLEQIQRQMENENQYVSTAQVANALSVSVTTVKRWVDEGVLPAFRTKGGHRKLLVSDVLRLARETNRSHAEISKLLPRSQPLVLAEPTAIRERLTRAIQHFDDIAIREAIHGAYQQGYSIEIIGDRILSPVMTEVGHQWEIGQIDVATEHRVTQAIVSALYELKGQLRPTRQSGRPVAVGGAPENDHTILGSLLCKLVLAENGWDAINLGPHTPVDAFISAMTSLKPHLIWVSVTHLADPEQFVIDFRRLAQAAEEKEVAIALGGHALEESIRSQLSYTTFGDGLSQFASFARTLHRLPRPR